MRASSKQRAHPPVHEFDQQGFIKALRAALAKHPRGTMAVARIEHQRWCDLVIKKKYCNCSPRITLKPHEPMHVPASDAETDRGY